MTPETPYAPSRLPSAVLIGPANPPTVWKGHHCGCPAVHNPDDSTVIDQDSPPAALLGCVVHCERADTGSPTNPAAGWELSPGCDITFGRVEGGLAVTVATADRDQQAGITQRCVTGAQIGTG
jgi:hypothetical protein